MFTPRRLSSKDTVKAVQNMIAFMVPKSKLKIDGLPGPATTAALNSLSSHQRLLINQLLEARGHSELILVPSSSRAKNTSGSTPIDYSQKLGGTNYRLIDLIDTAAATKGAHRIQVLNGSQRLSANEVIKNLTELAKMMSTIDKAMPFKVQINSGFRRGMSSSAHDHGLGLDIKPVGNSSSQKVQDNFAQLVKFVSANFKTDQLIVEMDAKSRNDVWLHIGLRRPNGQIRGQKFSMLQGLSNSVRNDLFDWKANKVIV